MQRFKYFKRTNKPSAQTRRKSFNFLIRKKETSPEEARNGDFLRPRRAGEGQSPEARTSKEIGATLREIGDELNNSTLSLHSAT